MQIKEFFPDYASRRVGRGYQGLFRFFDGDDWSEVKIDGEPTAFGTAQEAVDAAKVALKKALNPTIRGHKTARQAYIDAAAEWFANKHEARAREHTARKRGVRDVVFVEIKGKRYAKDS